MTAGTGSDGRLREALDLVCGRIVEEYGAAFRMDAASPEEVATHADLLRSAVLAHLDGQAPPIVSSSHLTRRILDRVRTMFLDRLDELTPAPPGGEVITVLRAVEQVALGIETDWRHRFSDRLSGPDGLELVVEVAHDLRSPLTSILFLAETLKRGRSGPLTSIQERQLGLIYSAAFGLTSVASDVIDLAQGGDRYVDLDPLPFSVTDILESVRDIVQPIAEEKGLEVRLSVPADQLRVGYPVALSRVLLNLTTNALKFTDEGHVEVTVEAKSATQVEFSVRDTGRGIPPSSMTMLFEPFRRRHRNGEYAFSGSGLGLSICRKLVEAMHSDLKVETEAGRGSRFFFVLELPPMERGEEDAGAAGTTDLTTT
ncbi:MAG TPA: HAMP domain-containing sensor histidine kinase [Gemmatimonadales bacterium]|nr:HAMP domain-containing sensor histidine kinase [Gemmatimonadales bacterium]